MTPRFIEIQDIGYSYPNGQKALAGINFSAGEGEAIGIIGPNGAGKSTLLQLMMGIFTPMAGRVRIDGRELNKKNLSLIRKKMGLLFQNSDDQLFCPTVKADVSFGPINMGYSADETERVVCRALEDTGITHLAERSPNALSGGEKKTAALASILSMGPEILLMDEASAGLDSRSRRRLIRIINSLPQTKILVSHDLDLIGDICERVVVLHEGRVVEDGPVETILFDKVLLEKYRLELPLRLQGCPRCGKDSVTA